MNLNNKIYRSPSNRVQWWDYSNNGTYFITICTKDRINYFGTIQQEEIILSPLGHSVLKCWNNIPLYHPYVILDAFIIMPNHIHGILHINNSNTFNDNSTLKKECKVTSGSLGSIIRGFKVGVKKDAYTLNIPFFWQPRYHDHIIRTAESYIKIANYIIMNPITWKQDKFYNNL
ncbi:hypothetical protein HX057_08420 [Myroides odoratimimus]|uniref:transposase n=1 Tax=Myroides odoratimimus TaxID=76832 RepID=UPI000353FD3F|nr:transposase [Myroides odoratimimus]EPH14030.1 hypothetical protein HMPREF9713_00230 [Myroides odoratimimus CCUG 12700]MDM1414343.1 hypothetical protein [Myroides odoratimimus]MDM1446776.1 hypothetical protein [Myroides odoratimimus]MEC4007900.1 hypothetical protein [Myroides odoratimimus]